MDSNESRPRGRHRRDDRGVSSVLATVIIIGLVATSAFALFITGANAITESKQHVQNENAEYAMSQLDSQASLVVLDQNTQSKTVNLGLASQGQVTVRKGANIKIVWDNLGGTTTLIDRDLNYIEYKDPESDVRMAYMAGGVWRIDESGATMVSPPEFHYNGETLTFPIVDVTSTGDSLSADSIRLTKKSKTNVFPSATRQNPVEGKKIRVKITTDDTEYYDAWARFFEERVDGVAVERKPSQHRTIVTLGRQQLSGDFDNAITAVGQVSAGTGNARVNGPVTATGDVYSTSPPAGYSQTPNSFASFSLTPLDSAIQSKITDGQNGNLDQTLSGLAGQTLTSTSNPDTGRTYFIDGDISITSTGDSATVDLSDGNVTLVHNGDIDFEDGDLKVETGGTDNVFKMYTDANGMEVSGNSNLWVEEPGDSSKAPPRDAEHFQLYGTSTMQFGMANSGVFEGVIYAPRNSQVSGPPVYPNGAGTTQCSLNDGTYADMCIATGSSEFHGAIIGGPTAIAQSSDLYYDSDLSSFGPTVSNTAFVPPPLTYLHVATHTVEAEGS